MLRFQPWQLFLQNELLKLEMTFEDCYQTTLILSKEQKQSNEIKKTSDFPQQQTIIFCTEQPITKRHVVYKNTHLVSKVHHPQ